jgi:transposase-like protein
MSETFSKVEVITGVARRRRFTTEQKLSVANETLQPGLSISYVASSTRHLRRGHRAGLHRGAGLARAGDDFPSAICRCGKVA